MSTPKDDPYSPEFSEDELGKLQSPDEGRDVFDAEFNSQAGKIADEIAGEPDDSDSLEDTETDDGGQELQEQTSSEPDGEQGKTEASQTSQDDAWITQSVLDFAGTYGMSDVDVRSLGMKSQGELERFLVSLDKYANSLLKIPEVEQGQRPASVSAAEQATPPPGAAPAPDRPGYKNGKIDLEYYRSTYDSDDPILAVVERAAQMEDDLQKQRETNEAVIRHLATQQQYEQTNAFHAAVDSYNPDFFGRAFDKKTGQPCAVSGEYLKRRNDVLEYTVNTLMPIVQRQMSAGLVQQPPTYPELVHRAARALYANELDTLESKRKAALLTAQAAKKRHVGSASPGYRNRPVRNSNRPMTDFEKLNSDPELIASWETMKAETGR